MCFVLIMMVPIDDDVEMAWNGSCEGFFDDLFFLRKVLVFLDSWYNYGN